MDIKQIIKEEISKFLEIGDNNFPLVINPNKNISKDNELVGRVAIVNDNAKESFNFFSNGL